MWPVCRLYISATDPECWREWPTYTPCQQRDFHYARFVPSWRSLCSIKVGLPKTLKSDRDHGGSLPASWSQGDLSLLWWWLMLWRFAACQMAKGQYVSLILLGQFAIAWRRMARYYFGGHQSLVRRHRQRRRRGVFDILCCMRSQKPLRHWCRCPHELILCWHWICWRRSRIRLWMQGYFSRHCCCGRSGRWSPSRGNENQLVLCIIL